MEIGATIGLPLGEPTRNAFGDALRDAGARRSDLVVVDGDVGNSTRTEVFGQAFPERFFQVGIAESNMVSIAAGLAASGHVAVTASFAAFLTANAFDQIRMGVGFTGADVKLVGSHAGISIGDDGPSQMGIEDIALMTAIPGMTVLCPADAAAARTLTAQMIERPGPAYMRTGRPRVPTIYADGHALAIGRASQLRDGSDATVMACGIMVAMALEAAHALAAEGIAVRVLDVHTIAPLDVDAVVAAARETGAIVTAEEHLLAGGLGSAVARAVVAHQPCPMGFVGIDDTYAESGKPGDVLAKYGLTWQRIAGEVRRLVGGRGATAAPRGL